MPLDALDLPPLVLGGAPGLAYAPWWREAPHGVLNALMRAQTAAPHLAALAELLLPRLPHGVLASSTIKGEGERAFSRVIRLEEALRHRWISWNTGDWTNIETVDCDHADWRRRLAHMMAWGLPAPAFVVLSPWKGTAHLAWIYDRPFRRDDPDQVRVRKGIKRGLALAFGGDPRFSNRLGKNPWHVRDGLAEPEEGEPGDPAAWADYRERGLPLTYHTEIHRLATVTVQELLTPLLAYAADELDGAFLLAPKPRALRSGAAAVVIPGAAQPGPNDLFQACADATRRARTADPATIAAIVSRTAAAWGRTVSTDSQAAIVCSISTWMTTKWRGPLDGRTSDARPGKKPINERVMTGEAADRGPVALAEWKASTLVEKRQAAARRSAEHVEAGHDEAILRALVALAEERGAITLDILAERSGVSPRTVKRRARTFVVPFEAIREKVPHGLICPCAPRRGAAPPAQPGLSPESESFLPSTVLLGDAVRLLRAASREAGRAEAAAVAAYGEAAARMLRPGAAVEAVSPPPPAASTRLREAHAGALAAQVSARRRAEDRRRRASGRVRAVERESWHQEHAGDAVAWAARLAWIAEDRVEAVERLLRSEAAAERMERMEQMFSSIIGAEHRARRRAQGLPDVHRRRRSTAAELKAAEAIPW